MKNTSNSLSENNLHSLHLSGFPFETSEEDILLFFKDYKIKSAKVYR